MLKDAKGSIVVGYGLSLLYGISAIFYWLTLENTRFRGHALVLCFLFFALFICSLAIVRLWEWGRRLLVAINAGMCLYLLALFIRFPHFVHASYIFVNISAALFFNQENIKAQFHPGFAFTRKSILVIDDDASLLRTVKRLLLSRGYSVLATTTGERGLQVAKAQRPDLIILDVILPGIKGREVCAALKQDEHTKDIPVIFLTAKDSADDIKAEMEAGGAAHLTKPLNTKTLMAEITKIFG